MSLDLGSLVGEVRLDATLFETTYVRVVRQMAELGAKAGAAAAGTSTLDRSLAEAGASANAAAAGLGRADRALAGTGVSASDAAVATGTVSRATSEAALASSRLTQALLREQAARARLTELEASGTATERQLAAARASTIAASDRSALAQERLGKSTGVTSQAWQSAGRGMVIAGGLIAAGMVIAGKAAADFDAKMTLVRTLAKASPQDMAQLRSAALTVGQAYGYSAGQVADAEAELVKAGISVKDIMGGALIGALTLAAAGQEDVASATNTAAVAMTQFQMSGKDVPHIADLLAAGADKALGSVADLSEALSYGGVAAHQAGMSIEETIGVLSMLAQSGQLGSIAGTQLAMMLRNLEAPTSKAKAEMKDLGIQVYGSNGQMLSMATIATELHDKIGKLPPAQRDAALAALFTARSIRAANILMRDGGDAVREWTQRVDASGFAALQASGKLDSLSGDLTKLKSALNAALIGTGETAQGPLRSVVEDVTKVITTFTGLPGPVRSGMVALIGITGAVTLFGGAAIITIPKVAALDVALQSMSGGAITARSALGALGKATVAGAVLVGLYEGAKALGSALQDDATPSVNAFTDALIDMSHSGAAANRDLINFLTGIAHLPSGFGLQTRMIRNLDAAMADLVTGGHLEMARSDFAIISDTLHRSGMTTAEITKLFPHLASALSDSATSAKLAADGVDKYGNSVGAAAQKTKSATDVAKAYSDTLHALADPLFAMNQALVDLRAKQAAATADMKKYGTASQQTKQSQIAVASSALGVAAAAKALAGSVRDGTTSLSGAREMLHEWVAAGILTKAEAAAVATAFGGIIDKADHVSSSIDKAAGVARAAAGKFHTAGEAAAAGYAAGITDGQDAAIRAAADMGLLSYQAARNAIRSKSPSKLFAELGVTVPEGFATGIAAGTSKTEGAAKKMAAATRKATIPPMTILGADLAAALSSGFGGYQGQMAKIFTGSTLSALDSVANQLHTAIGKYQNDLQGRSQMRTSIAQGLLGAADISQLSLSNTGGGGIRANNANVIAELTRENKDVKRLKKLHLDPTYLQQIAAASPEQAVMLAEDILSGKEGSISGLNRQQRQLQALAGSIGGNVADASFAHALAADKKTLEHLAHALVAFVNKKLDLSTQAERAMERAFERALHKAAPGISLKELDRALGRSGG